MTNTDAMRRPAAAPERANSRVRLAALFLGPMLADLLVCLVFFSLNIQAVRMGIPPRIQAWVSGLFAVGYMASSHLAGRWTTPRNATRIIIAAVAGMGILGTVSAVARVFGLCVLLAGLMGVAAAHFFVPFQVRMRNVRPFPSLATTVAFYNLSWGLGWTVGPFTGGWLRGASPLWMMGVVWGLMLSLFVLVLTTERGGNDNRRSPLPSAEYSSTPLLRRISWMGVFVANTLIVGLAATLWPAMGNARGLTDVQIGLGLSVMALQVPLSSLFWARMQRLRIGPELLLAAMLTGGLGCAILPLAPSAVWLMIALALLGFAYAGVMFHGVYFSNADPETAARSVGINESMIGAGNILGPFLLGWLAWNDATSLRPYMGGAAIMLVSAAFGLAMWRQVRARAAGSPVTTLP